MPLRTEAYFQHTPSCRKKEKYLRNNVFLRSLPPPNLLIDAVLGDVWGFFNRLQQPRRRLWLASYAFDL